MDLKTLIKLTDVDDTSDNAASIGFATYPFKRTDEPSWSDLPERPGQHIFPDFNFRVKMKMEKDVLNEDKLASN